MKQINYKLAIAKSFPAHHPRKGQKTGFWDKINSAHWPYDPHKIHTIRSNYDLWEKRFKKIEAGEAVLTMYEWSGLPRKSNHIELVTLTREDGIGLQKIEIEALYVQDHVEGFALVHEPGNRKFEIEFSRLAKNDGLSEQDLIDWFKLKPGESTEPLALIHFTKFRY